MARLHGYRHADRTLTSLWNTLNKESSPSHPVTCGRLTAGHFGPQCDIDRWNFERLMPESDGSPQKRAARRGSLVNRRVRAFFGPCSGANRNPNRRKQDSDAHGATRELGEPLTE